MKLCAFFLPPADTEGMNLDYEDLLLLRSIMDRFKEIGEVDHLDDVEQGGYYDLYANVLDGIESYEDDDLDLDEDDDDDFDDDFDDDYDDEDDDDFDDDF